MARRSYLKYGFLVIAKPDGSHVIVHGYNNEALSAVYDAAYARGGRVLDAGSEYRKTDLTASVKAAARLHNAETLTVYQWENPANV